MENLLEVHKLSKHYKDFTLSNLSLNVPSGSVVGFIGANGAGKTTVIKSILGLIRFDSGEIKILGENPGNAGIHQLLGVVFDKCSFNDWYTVQDIEKIMAVAYKNFDPVVFNEYLTKFGLSKRKRVKKLSRGMGMKLSLACALSHNPELLILDEATAGLDPLAREEVLDILRDFVAQEGHGILMSSHITSDLENIADYIVCIDAGRAVFSMEKDAITDRAGLAQCREAEFDNLIQSNFFAPGTMRFMQNKYGISVLVLDRFEFTRNFPKIPLERVNIDQYLQIILKGEFR